MEPSKNVKQKYVPLNMLNIGQKLSNFVSFPWKFDNPYYHNDRDYVIQVVAVDGGAGWGELEGRAIVEAKPIYYHSRPFMKPLPPPDPLEEIPEECKWEIGLLVYLIIAPPCSGVIWVLVNIWRLYSTYVV